MSELNADFLDLPPCFADAEVRRMVVGGYAVAVHGHPRATKDLDLWVEPTVQNAERVVAALQAFGAPLGGMTATGFATPGLGFMMGVPPRRIDAGLSFAEAWQRRVEVMSSAASGHRSSASTIC
jgi:hypothetical protein